MSPDAALIVATAAFEELQVPPVDVEVKFVVNPAQMF